MIVVVVFDILEVLPFLLETVCFDGDLLHTLGKHFETLEYHIFCIVLPADSELTTDSSKVPNNKFSENNKDNQLTLIIDLFFRVRLC